MKRSRVFLVALVSCAIGVVIGGNLFAHTQPRSLIALRECPGCLAPRELAGLMASVGIEKIGGRLPFVDLETDKTIAFKYPVTRGFHYLIVPKKDLKDIDDLSPVNAAYLTDAFQVARRLIERDHMYRYSLAANGPGYQSVRYLHFHLVSQGRR